MLGLLVAMVFAAALALTIVYVYHAHDVQDQVNRATVLAADVAVVALLPVAAQAVYRICRMGFERRTCTPAQLDDAQRTLADLVKAQWREEILARGLDDPAALPVRWRQAWHDLADLPENVAAPNLARTPPAGVRGPVAGSVDDIASLAEQFRGLSKRRLVILGGPGMGKTSFAVLLLRELLEHPQKGDKVPVLFSLSAWNPDELSLHEWLADQLTKTYPALRAEEFGCGAPLALVTGIRILPILDGLDEMPAPMRIRALSKLNAALAGSDPLVLTCRTRDYQAVVTAVGGDVLNGAAVVAPMPLKHTDVADYLRRCLRPNPDAGWKLLLEDLTSDAKAPVSQALETPLTIWLFRQVYLEAHVDPGPLLNTAQFPTARSVIEHLADHLIPTLFRRAAVEGGAAATRRPFKARRRWNVDTAQRCLRCLAISLEADGSHDIAWWRLDRLVPAVVLIAMRGAVGGALFGVGFGLSSQATFGTRAGIVFGAMGAIAVLFACFARPAAAALLRAANGSFGISLLVGAGIGSVYAVVFALAAGIVETADSGTHEGLRTAVACAVVSGPAIAFVASRAGEPPYGALSPSAWARLQGRDVTRALLAGAVYVVLCLGGIREGLPLPSLIWIAGLLVFASTTSTDFVPARLDLRAKALLSSFAGSFARGGASGLSVTFMFVLAYFIPVGYAYGLTVGDIPFGFEVGFVFALGFGLVGGLAGGLVDGLSRWVTTPQPTETGPGPSSSLRNDARLNAVRVFATGLAIAVAPGILKQMQNGIDAAFSGAGGGLDARALADMLTLPDNFSLAISGALMVGIASVLASSSANYLIAVVLLWLKRRVPLRFMSFLEDAHRVGVLRQVGRVYQFRHTLLQERLSSSQARVPSELPAGTVANEQDT